jgi:OmpA-OmpF porin, OOP family
MSREGIREPPPLDPADTTRTTGGRMATYSPVTALCIAAAALALHAMLVEAQIGRRLQDAAKRAAEKEATQQIEQRATSTVRCLFDDLECIRKAESDGKTVEKVDSKGVIVKDSPAPAGGAAPAPPAAFVNFDFVPGDRVLFAEDFSRDQAGDFPRRMEFGVGNMEVADWRGARWLRGTAWPSTFAIPLPEVLPERFTIEMDVVPGTENNNLEVHFSDPAFAGRASRTDEHFVVVRYFQNTLHGGVRKYSTEVSVARAEEKVTLGTPFPLRIMADGKYVKVYAGGTRVGNIPNASFPRENKIWIKLPASNEHPGYVANIRVAAGGKKLYDAIAAEGRVATQGILFDTGSDRIRPESAPTLEEIGKMLKEHPDLRLRIEGHTDNVGQAAANQSLSEKRAAAVRAHLVSTFGINAARLESQGLGATKPAGSNDSPEGRQQNRRVELVKI